MESPRVSALAAPLLGVAQEHADDAEFSAATNAVIRCAVRLSMGCESAACVEAVWQQMNNIDRTPLRKSHKQRQFLLPVQDPHQPDDVDKGAMTELEATFALCNMVFNYGLFAIPFVFMSSGHISCVFVFVTAGVCICSAQLIGEVLQELKNRGIDRPDYSDMARELCGPKLALLMGVFANGEIFTYAWGSLLLLGHSFPQLFPAIGMEETIVGCSALTLILSAIPDKAYAYTAFVAAAAIVTACCVLLASGLELPRWSEGSRIAGPVAHLPQSISLLVFAAGTHPILPSIFENTPNKETFNRVARNSWLIWASFACVFGAVSYFMFGDSIRAVAFQNIGLDLDGEHLTSANGFAGFALAWIVFKLQGALVQLTRPVANNVSRIVGLELPAGSGGWKTLVATIPVVIIFGCGAYALRNALQALECIAGCTIMAFTAFTFPGVAFLGICKPERFASRVTGVVTACSGALVTAIMLASHV